MAKIEIKDVDISKSAVNRSSAEVLRNPPKAPVLTQ
jgi:hypothetical protein